MPNFNINADIDRAFADWDRAVIGRVERACRYEEEYSDESGMQGVSRALLMPRHSFDAQQGDEVETITTIDGRRIGPFTIEEIQYQSDATVLVRLRDGYVEA